MKSINCGQSAARSKNSKPFWHDWFSFIGTAVTYTARLEQTREVFQKRLRLILERLRTAEARNEYEYRLHRKGIA
jgi:hypothetical protein